MKREADFLRVNVAFLILVVTLLIGCGGSRSAVDQKESDEDRVDVGYGTVDRKGVTGSISTLDQEDIENRSVTRVEELIEGNVAGVRVVRTAGGGFSILIRGVNSIHGSNEPLYVIDGLPIQVAPNEGIGWLNPNDIESITILKSASETAIYGVRGGNGVVVIRTKRP